MKFQSLLKKKILEFVSIDTDIDIDTDPNHMVNSLLCTFFNIFQACFPFKYKNMKDKYEWITQGIKMSCKHK